MTKKNEIMGVEFNSQTKDELMDNIKLNIINENKAFIVTANPEIIMETRESEYYKKIINSADYTVADGTGVVFASRVLKKEKIEKIPGIELMESMLNHANSTKLKCYFLGATQEVNNQLLKKIKIKYPDLIISGAQNGYDNVFNLEIVEKVVRVEPDLIFVALGCPKQEKWIYENFNKFKKGIFIGVGGSFDVLSGDLKRAPKFFRKYNIEWFFRILQSPKRIVRLTPIIKFVILVLFKRE